ncbi:MAG: saccharopine dehydrogenase C-terminal domain-containing protein [Bacillota bacterium]
MKTILVLGAGRVARPCVQYLLRNPVYHLKIVDRDQENAQNVAGGHPRAESLSLDARGTFSLMLEADIVVNLLPAHFQAEIAALCLEARKPMVSASYPSEGTRSLHEEAVRAGIVLMCEIGVDPGIDHMLAAKAIDRAKREGGTVTGFRSCCGALPAPEANTNPFGYKFSWSPHDLLEASRRPARYLAGGLEVKVPGETLLEHYSLEYVEDLCWFEVYPNGDALQYKDLYGIQEVREIFRGTYRYTGWCETLSALISLGILRGERMDLTGMTYGDLCRSLLGGGKASDLEERLVAQLSVPRHSAVMKRIQWLGLLDERATGRKEGSVREAVTDLLLERLRYEKTERDMLVMQIELDVEEKGSTRKRLVSTLVDYGVPGGDSAIARTTGLPVGIVSSLILEGRIREAGVQIPIHRAIYEPVLDELEVEGLRSRKEEAVLSG